MVISRSAYWALKAIVHLADRRSHYGPQVSASVAAAINAPVDGTARLLRHLSVAGILVSFRGLGGGFLLARDSTEITALEVCQAVSQVASYAADLSDSPVEAGDGVDRLMQALSRDVRNRLAATSIDDLMSETRGAGASR